MRTLHAPIALATALLLVLSTGALALASGDPGAPLGGLPAAQENANPSTNLGYLFAIYIITWAGFFAYVFMVSRRQRSLEREMEHLRKLLADRQSAERSQAD